MQGKKVKELRQILRDEQIEGAEEFCKAATVDDATQVARDLLTVICQAEKLTMDIERNQMNPHIDSSSNSADLRAVMKWLDAMETRLGGALTSRQPTQKGQKTYSQVAARGTR
jgi:hypothetical protein